MKSIQQKHSNGFSLIELMIAMLIGLIVLNGVVQVVIGSKRTYLDNQAVSQIQENARYAIETLTREIRVAGYVGCMPSAIGEIDSTAFTSQQAGFLLDGSGTFAAIQAFNEDDSALLPPQIRGSVKDGTDVIIVRHTDTDAEWVLEDDLATLGNSLPVAVGQPARAPVPGQPLALVSHDCLFASLFNSTGVNNTGNSYVITATAPQGKFGLNKFKKGSRVAPVVVYAYYIGESSVLPDMPALMREVIVMDGTDVKTRSEELAVGVENMQIRTSLAGVSNLQFDDPNPSNRVIALEVELTLRSHKPVNSQAGEDGGYIRKVASATVRVRNQG